MLGRLYGLGAYSALEVPEESILAHGAHTSAGASRTLSSSTARSSPAPAPPETSRLSIASKAFRHGGSSLNRRALLPVQISRGPSYEPSCPHSVIAAPPKDTCELFPDLGNRKAIEAARSSLSTPSR